MAISAGNAAVLVPVFQPGDQQHRRRIATWALTVSQDIVDIHNSISAADANNAALSTSVTNLQDSLSAYEVIVAMAANNASGHSVTGGNTTRVLNWTTEYDTNNAFNASAGVYTIPVTGLYRLHATMLFNQVVNNIGVMRFYKNSATNIVSQLTSTNNGATATYCSMQAYCLVSCSAGDQITLSTYQSVSNNMYNGGANSADARTYNKLYIEKVK